MSTNYKPAHILPYKIGHKIRVVLGRSEGDHRVTFGKVVEIGSDGIPTIRYRDYSDMRMSEFDRVVKEIDVRQEGKFKEAIWKY